MIRKVIAIIACLLMITTVSNAQEVGYKTVGPNEFKAMMEKDKSAVLIDLRTPDEISKGKIKGAVEINFLANDIEAQIDALDKSKTYYLYCAGGGRSTDCSEMMVNKGFKHIVNLDKGFMGWKKEGLEIEVK